MASSNTNMSTWQPFTGTIESNWGDDMCLTIDDKLHMSETSNIQTVEGPVNFSKTGSTYSFGSILHQFNNQTFSMTTVGMPNVPKVMVNTSNYGVRQAFHPNYTDDYDIFMSERGHAQLWEQTMGCHFNGTSYVPSYSGGILRLRYENSYFYFESFDPTSRGIAGAFSPASWFKGVAVILGETNMVWKFHNGCRIELHNKLNLLPSEVGVPLSGFESATGSPSSSNLSGTDTGVSSWNLSTGDSIRVKETIFSRSYADTYDKAFLKFTISCDEISHDLKISYSLNGASVSELTTYNFSETINKIRTSWTADVSLSTTSRESIRWFIENASSTACTIKIYGAAQEAYSSGTA